MESTLSDGFCDADLNQELKSENEYMTWRSDPQLTLFDCARKGIVMVNMKSALAITCILLAIICLAAFGFRRFDIPQIEGRSGQGFQMGRLSVDVMFGYADDGDRLLFAIVRSYPPGTPAADSRVKDDYGGAIFVRNNDGQMIPVKRDGRLYLFDEDNNVRTMKVKMNEHSDTDGLTHCRDMEEIWDLFKRFEVPL